MPYARGRLIVIEGGDSSGKTTQAALLAHALSSKDKKVATFEFPRYKKSVFADLTTRCIKGEFGDFRTLSPYLASLPYMLDRVRAKNVLVESLIDGHVICDRYTTSNIVYQAVKLPEKERDDFISFIEKAEYGELGLPMPNLVIYLNVSVAAAIKSYSGDSNKPTFLYPQGDKYKNKKNIEYQEEVVDLYRRFSQKRINWFVIDCMEGKKMLSAKEIHSKILKIVGKYLNIK
jgi:dTMP kinase